MSEEILDSGDLASRLRQPTLVRQRTATTCGQCVIAMLLGVPRSTAIDIIGHDGITDDDEIWYAAGTDSGFTDGPPPDDVVAVQKHRDPDGSREHWTLWWKGVTLDPRNRVDELWPVAKHFVVDWAC